MRHGSQTRLSFLDIMSLDIFETADIKSLPSKASAWVSSGTVPIDDFFSVYGPYFSLLCKSHHFC